jgi:cytochrome c6
MVPVVVVGPDAGALGVLGLPGAGKADASVIASMSRRTAPAPGGAFRGAQRVLRLSAPALAAEGTGQGAGVVSSSGDVGRKTFEVKCIACHEAGGNSLGGPGLGKESLASRGLGSAEAVAGIVAKGKGRMPSYGETAPPFARLTQEEIDAVSQFVLEQAEAGWQR